MAKIVGLASVAVTATPARVSLPGTLFVWTLQNEGPDPVFYKFDRNTATCPSTGGTAAVLSAAAYACVRAGETVLLDGQGEVIPWLDVACATGLTATLRIEPGQLTATTSEVGSATAVQVETTGTVVATIGVGGAEYLTVNVANAGSHVALSDFQIHVRAIAGGAWEEVELTDGAYVEDYTTGIATLASGSSGIVRMHVIALYAVKFTATVGSAHSHVTLQGTKA